MSAYVVGLTGGVASGKSEVERRFAALGVTVADADAAARDAVAPGSEGLAAVVETFGAGVLQGDGSLDRARMRELVFADADARRRLEAIVHPQVRLRLRAACEAAQGPYAIASIPLLAEGGRDHYPWIDRVLVVDVPRALQLARLQRRDGIDAALAERMLAAQVDRLARLELADDVIYNDGPLDALAAHVAALDARYRQLAEGSR
ncbi:dephospho-CoA kinase [Lysobacteraceae bacterium NML91-0213]|nr:dephospho-CoA kinase [Xanthomonadaceae bacterium NML91-0213]